MAQVTRIVKKTLPSVTMSRTDAADRLKVAAYARVSTDREEQEDSFERQVTHYTQLIAANPAWMPAGIYADPGISGTRAEKRPDFLRMIADCRAGKIQKVLVKSISRFARNTVDALQYIRELKDLGISVYFESENIDTLTPGGEVLLAILAAMAEQESRTISANIRWAYQKKFERGEVILNTGSMLGYRKAGKDENGMNVYEIVPEEAQIIRRIYREYIAGVPVTRICRSLEADGIKTKFGKDVWQPNVVESILSNEKYTGNAILGKTFKPDVLSKKRIKNDGTRAPQYLVENTHPAIIEKEIFDLAQEQRERRKDGDRDAVGNSRFTSKYPFSGLLVCRECGAKLRRHVRTVGGKEKVASWGCANRIVNGRAACDSRHVREDVLEKTYFSAVRRVLKSGEEAIDTAKRNVRRVLGGTNGNDAQVISQRITQIQEAVLALHHKRQQNAITEAAYAERIADYAEQMQTLEEQSAACQKEVNRMTEIGLVFDTFREHMRSGTVSDPTDAGVMRQLVEKIIVGTDGIEIMFKCGVRVGERFEKTGKRKTADAFVSEARATRLLRKYQPS